MHHNMACFLVLIHVHTRSLLGTGWGVRPAKGSEQQQDFLKAQYLLA